VGPYSSNAMALGIITLHWVFYMKKRGIGCSLILEFKKLQPEVINKSKYPPTPVYICLRTLLLIGKRMGAWLLCSLFCQNLKLKTEKCENEVILGVFRYKEIFNFKIKITRFLDQSSKYVAKNLEGWLNIFDFIYFL